MRCDAMRGTGALIGEADERFLLIEWNVVCLAMHTADVGVSQRC